MEPLLYKVIKTEKQYHEYEAALAGLTILEKRTSRQQDALELLALLIDRYRQDHHRYSDTDPVSLLRRLMAAQQLRSIDLATGLGISKSLLSDILSYRRGLSKEMIRKLAGYFNLPQEAFNKPYALTAISKP